MFSVCLLALLRAVPGVSVPEHHHELGHGHHGAVGGAQHRARAQQRPAAERVETGDAEMGLYGLCMGWAYVLETPCRFYMF